MEQFRSGSQALAPNPRITLGQMAAYTQEWPPRSLYSLSVYFCLFLFLLAPDLRSGWEPGKDNRRRLTVKEITAEWLQTKCGGIEKSLKNKLDEVDVRERYRWWRLTSNLCNVACWTFCFRCSHPFNFVPDFFHSWPLPQINVSPFLICCLAIFWEPGSSAQRFMGNTRRGCSVGVSTITHVSLRDTAGGSP